MRERDHDLGVLLSRIEPRRVVLGHSAVSLARWDTFAIQWPTLPDASSDRFRSPVGRGIPQAERHTGTTQLRWLSREWESVGPARKGAR